MTDSITATMDDLQLATENYVSLPTKGIRADAPDDASDAILSYYNRMMDEGKASGAVLEAIMECADLAWGAGWS